MTKNIRNFSIIAHIDHGKSTLADRLLEATGTIEKRKMTDQVLDRMDLERERGITIKMQPARMVYEHYSSRRNDAEETQKNAEGEFLYEELSYTIRGVLFEVKKRLGLGHKEQVYHNALEIAFKKAGLSIESKKNISIVFEGQKIGSYQPDFIIENKILIELKALPEIGRPQIEQVWSYIKGCEYRLALLVNYGSTGLEIKRIVYDTAREADVPRSSASSLRNSAGGVDKIEYVLNLIDTPGHIDFAYEVSRALKAVEGALLLVDSTQGIQAQTLSTLHIAREQDLVIIPVITKVDAQSARPEEVGLELAALLECQPEEVIRVSGKTGEGVDLLLKAIVERIPAPRASEKDEARALIFDFTYSNHKGVVIHARVFDGTFSARNQFLFAASKEVFTAGEVGIFAPDETPKETLGEGEIGYIVTGIKEPGVAAVGDTVQMAQTTLRALPGYQPPQPVVWASVYPESQDDFTLLRQSLDRLRLSDSSLSFEEESSQVLGRGFRCGFLGMLHLEIVVERLRREFNLELMVTTPSIAYTVILNNGTESVIYSPSRFPEHGAFKRVDEPWVVLKVLFPSEYMNAVMPVLYEHEGEIVETETFSGERVLLSVHMPLRELMRGFFDTMKSASSGYASLSYEILGSREADVARLDVLVAEEEVPAFARIVARRRVDEEAGKLVEKLHEALPKQLFTTKIQGKAFGRIIASKTLSAMRKDVTGHLYGGDVTRKRKLLEKQKKGKKKMKERGKVHIPHDVFMKIVKE